MDESSSAEERDAGFGLKQRIIDAVRAGDVELLTRALEAMDEHLTSHSRLRQPNQIRGQKDDIEKFLQGVARAHGKNRQQIYLYLNDGGVSRIFVIVDEGNIKVDISTQSTPEVFEKWRKL